MLGYHSFIHHAPMQNFHRHPTSSLTEKTTESTGHCVTSLLINSHWEGCLFGLPVCFTRETGERMEHVQRRWLAHFIHIRVAKKVLCGSKSLSPIIILVLPNVLLHFNGELVYRVTQALDIFKLLCRLYLHLEHLNVYNWERVSLCSRKPQVLGYNRTVFYFVLSFTLGKLGTLNDLFLQTFLGKQNSFNLFLDEKIEI